MLIIGMLISNQLIVRIGLYTKVNTNNNTIVSERAKTMNYVNILIVEPWSMMH